MIEKKSKHFKISVKGSLPILEKEKMVVNRERDTVFQEQASVDEIVIKKEEVRFESPFEL